MAAMKRNKIKFVLCLLLCLFFTGCRATQNSNPSDSLAAQRAEVAKLRDEINAALESDDAGPAGVIVQPKWTKQGNSPKPGPPSKVIVNEFTLKAAKELRTEIGEAVARQGHTEDVRKLEMAFKEKLDGSGKQAVVGMIHEEMLGSKQTEVIQANVVDASPLDIDLTQLQQLQLSKRRTREMLVLSRIVEDLQFMLDTDVSHWLQLLQNGSVYFVGRRKEDLLLLQQKTSAVNADSLSFEPLQSLPVPAGIDVMLSYQRWNTQLKVHESLLMLATQQQLIWYRLEVDQGLSQFWHWPLGTHIGKLLAFATESREYLALVHNHTLSIYAYDVEGMEFWIVQRLQLMQAITALAVLDTGRDLLLALGQANEALIYAHNMRELGPDAGLQLELRQRLDAPQIADIAAFQMGGRSYLALGGNRPQILVYEQGQLIPKTVLGQNFGLVELFLPVPVRSYRDDLLLLVQHRIYFDSHTLTQLEVLVWNGEAFEAGLPPPCELGAQTYFGAGCMLDEQRDAGLLGAALLRQVQPPMLLVPRESAPSGLFRLHTQLLPRNSELHDLQEIQDFMREWVDEHDKLLEQAEQLLQLPQSRQKPTIYEEVQTPVLINDGAIFDALHVNDFSWTIEDATTDLHIVLQEIRLLNAHLRRADIERAKRQPQLFRFDYEQLHFDIVDVQELSIDQLNHVPFYIQNATLQFNGSINVQQLDLLQPKLAEPLESLPSSTLQRLQIPGDLNCELINGLKWTQFVENLVWRQEPLQLSQLKVQGAVVFEDSLHLSVLNELNFPDDYLWSQGSSTSIIRAPKQFAQTLATNVLDTGSINGIDPMDAITLSDAQDWPGYVTFTKLEVSEQLELNGSAQGRQFEDAPANPTLNETHTIYAACHLTQLVVNGTLKLRGQLDNSNYDALLADLAQRRSDANDELLIPSLKHVKNLSLPLDAHVTDGKLSGIPIGTFVTKHTEQTLHNLSSLGGYVYFHELQLSGAYDGVQLDQLLSQTLRVDAPLVAPSTNLRFVHEPQLTELQVKQSLNGVPLASGFQTLHEPLHLGQASFERLQAEHLDVTNNVTGEALLNGRHINKLMENASQPNTVQVQDLILPMGVQATRLQGIKAELLLGFLRQLDELPLLILHGQLQVENIKVIGAVQLEDTLNGVNLAQLQREAVWLDQPNDLRTRWRFEEPPIFDGDLLLQGSYNDRLLPELLDDIVFRSDRTDELIILGTKSFLGNVYVRDALQLQALNGVPFTQLANKLQPLEFDGELHLKGQLHVENLQLQGKLNNHEVSQLGEQLLWHPQLAAFVQRGWIQLPQMQLQHLTVLGHLGNRSQEPLKEFFDNLLDKRQSALRLDDHKIFTGRVSIRKGAHITKLNDVQVDQLLQQLIFIDSDKEVLSIHTPVRFEAPVEMQQLQVEQLLLQGSLLNGCNISEWIHDTVRVDQNWRAESPITFAQGALNKNELLVDYLNDLDLSRVVTLHTAQNLSFPLLSKELYLEDGQLQLHGLVNGYNLLEEYLNTLLVNAPKAQLVQTPLVLQSTFVGGSVAARSFINGDLNLNLSDVATLQERELRLQTPLHFDRILAPELRTRLHINGFNFSAWHEKSLWAKGRASQIINGNWRVRWLRLKQSYPRNQRQTGGAMGKTNYLELCQRLVKFFGALQLQYQVTQQRHSFTLYQAEHQADLRRVFAVQSASQKSSYLLLNELGCWTRIKRWNGTHYVSAGAFESGPVDEVAVLTANNTNQFTFMTSYELDDEQQASNWNCSGLANLQSWRTSSQLEIEPMAVSAQKLQQLQQQHTAQQQQRRVPSYQHVIKYLNRPSIESQLRPHLDSKQPINREHFETLRERLLQDLDFRLQTEINITQLSIPESDLYYDEQLVENFLGLMHQLQLHVSKYDSKILKTLRTDALPLPNNPARVLAARSAQLIWPVLEELNALHARLPHNNSQQEDALMVQLEQTVYDVLVLANNNSHVTSVHTDDETAQLHAVITRVRLLQRELQPNDIVAAGSSRQELQLVQPVEQQWRPVQTIRLYVGPARQAKLLYARLNIVDRDMTVAPSTSPAAFIQLHHANGTLFQSLAADLRARQLTTLRVRDETLLAFVEGCCRVRVFIYRGIQGFVPFTQFQAKVTDQSKSQPNVLQLMAIRLSLQRAPGAAYMLAVVQTRQIDFYELQVPGLFETWLNC